MRVLHVINTISRTSGGPARSCQGLVAALCEAGVDASLLSLSPGEKPWHKGIKKYFNNVKIEEVLLSERPDIVHVHNLWRPELHHSVKVCRQYNVPYIMAPRGCLEPWSLNQKWVKKKIARILYQDKDLRHAIALHATAESEAIQFRRLGFTNPIIVCPNGVNVPEVFNRAEHAKHTERRLLFVSRMHPKKGALELVEAWGEIVASWKCGNMEKPDARWVVEMVYTISGGFESEYEEKVKTRVKELGLADYFIFTGALNDDDKWNAYAQADVFVLPTYSENFGIVVAEAMYAGLPIITTKGTPWQELEDKGCGWWIDLPNTNTNSSRWPALVSGLKQAIMLTDDERCYMGEKGRRLIQEKYSWSAIAQRMKEGYEKLKG